MPARAPENQRRRVCKQCETVFHVSPRTIGTFCSNACRYVANRKHPPIVARPCIICGADFLPTKSNRNAKYCSKRCIWKGVKGPEFNRKMVRDTLHARSDKMRGRGEGKGYRKRGGRHEHRVVAEEKLGRSLKRGEIVHHIDGNKQNNHPDNLAVMTQAEHMREHGLGLPGVTPAHKPWEYRK